MGIVLEILALPVYVAGGLGLSMLIYHCLIAIGDFVEHVVSETMYWIRER